ncbi:MAG: C40 family peptidase [Sulfurimonas sp.]|uniref:C40 family peptidase n=1 Tax=Sulfurimonas sp. TaxID=2022749 RepID=UPI0026287553|nr:C40 family peptidase [Sulfurimonas sp.]MDD2651887.1 C40 family peptidase [Sulfurimonas sp.]MDD3451796.1 C40 family peptidase [Sulfurimonas sp.]
MKGLFIVFFLLLTSHLAASVSTSQKIEVPYVIGEKAYSPSVYELLAKAEEYLGTSYRIGSASDARTDCSGFTQQVFGEFGIVLPHSAKEQARYGEKIDVKDLQAGDLLFYRTYKKGPSHVAIYAGNGQIIHASYRAKRVQYDAFDKKYYKQRFLYAKRIVFNDIPSDTRQN